MSSLKPFGDSFHGILGERIYAVITAIRNMYYTVFPPKKLPFPVISIGGISAGGTGKTPLTATVIEHIIHQGYTPVLFSRGYGRISNKCSIIPADESLPTWKEVGDEPAMLRNRYPQLWLAINGKRMIAAKELLKIVPEKCVAIMDDGFQHRQMPRDIDIVTIPESVHKDYLIPRGLLRESLSSLKRADIITVMGDLKSEDEKILSPFLNNRSTIGLVITEGGTFFNPSQNEETEFLTKPVTLFSGIARPERFHKMITDRGCSVKNVHSFSDHHIYSEQDSNLLSVHSNELLCTTEKDWIRLQGNNWVNCENLWYFTIEQRFSDEQFRKRFFDLIDSCLE